MSGSSSISSLFCHSRLCNTSCFSLILPNRRKLARSSSGEEEEEEEGALLTTQEKATLPDMYCCEVFFSGEKTSHSLPYRLIFIDDICLDADEHISSLRRSVRVDAL